MRDEGSRDDHELGHHDRDALTGGSDVSGPEDAQPPLAHGVGQHLYERLGDAEHHQESGGACHALDGRSLAHLTSSLYPMLRVCVSLAISMASPPLVLPGVLFVGEDDRARIVAHTGPAAGWHSPRGILGWSTEVSFVGRDTLTEEIRRTTKIVMPEEQIPPARMPLTSQAAQKSPLVAISSNVMAKLVEAGIRVHTVGVDRVTASFYYLAEGGVEDPIRIEGDLVQSVGSMLGERADNAAIERVLDGLPDRLLRALSKDRVSELTVELAALLPRASADGRGTEGTDLEAFEKQLSALIGASEKNSKTAQEIASKLADTNDRRIDVPLYGEARKVSQGPFDIAVGERRVSLPTYERWVLSAPAPQSASAPRAKSTPDADDTMLANLESGANAAADAAAKAAADAKAATDARDAKAVADAKAAAGAKAAAEAKAAADKAAAEARAKAAAEAKAAADARAAKAAADKAAAEARAKAAAETKAAAEAKAAEAKAAEEAKIAEAKRIEEEKTAAEKAAADARAAEAKRIEDEKAAAEKAAADAKAAEEKRVADAAKAVIDKKAADEKAAEKAAFEAKKADQRAAKKDGSTKGATVKTPNVAGGKSKSAPPPALAKKPMSPMLYVIALLVVAVAGAAIWKFALHH